MMIRVKHSLVHSIQDKKIANFIIYATNQLVPEFESYIQVSDDSPFWYNERALLGFFTNGLIRNTRTITIQEYSCEKKNKDKGRADLWVYDNGNTYLVEAKYRFRGLNATTEWKSLLSVTTKKALGQAKDYKNPDKASIITLCFEAIEVKPSHLKPGIQLSDVLKNANWFPTNIQVPPNSFCSLFFLTCTDNKSITRLFGRKPSNIYPALLLYGTVSPKH